LRKLVLGGDVLLGTVISVCMTKIALRLERNDKVHVGTLQTIAGVGRMAETRRAGRTGVHADCLDRLAQCARMLLDPQVKASMGPIFLQSGHDAFAKLIADQRASKLLKSEKEKKRTVSQADDLIQFRQLRAQVVQGGIEAD
jgi:hypothetical protein